MKKFKMLRGNHLHNLQDITEWADTFRKVKWMDIKEQSDTIVFVKIGRFYEAFHEDADILNEVFDTPYMKGIVAHTGFPVCVLDKYITGLREAGYNNIRLI